MLCNQRFTVTVFRLKHRSQTEADRQLVNKIPVDVQFVAKPTLGVFDFLAVLINPVLLMLAPAGVRVRGEMLTAFGISLVRQLSAR